MLQDGDRGVVLQRDRTTYAIAPHIPCGMATPAMLARIAAVAERRGLTLKITSAQRIALIGIAEEDVDAVWAELGLERGHPIGLCVRSVKACPGTDCCKRGLGDAGGLGRKLDAAWHGRELPGKMKFGVSGCPHDCAETCIKDIGAVATAKGWRIVAGGCGGARPRLATTVASGLDEEQALAAVERLVAFHRVHARPGERMARAVERLGEAAVVAAATGATATAP